MSAVSRGLAAMWSGAWAKASPAEVRTSTLESCKLLMIACTEAFGRPEANPMERSGGDQHRHDTVDNSFHRVSAYITSWIPEWAMGSRAMVAFHGDYLQERRRTSYDECAILYDPIFLHDNKLAEAGDRHRAGRPFLVIMVWLMQPDVDFLCRTHNPDHHGTDRTAQTAGTSGADVAYPTHDDLENLDDIFPQPGARRCAGGRRHVLPASWV